MLKIALSLLMPLLMLVAAPPAVAQIDRATAQALMHKSGLWDQLASIAPQMRSGLLDAMSNTGATLTPSELERLGQSVDQAYAANRLRLIAARSIAQNGDATHLAALRTWYDSRIGKDVTKLEEASSSADQDPAQAVQEGMAYLAQVPQARRELLERVVSVTRSAEMLVSITINTAIAMQGGLSSAVPGVSASPLEDLARSLSSQRSKMMQASTIALVALSSKTYAPLPDADLRKYIEFLESPAGKRFTEIGLQALDAALTDAAHDFGRSIPAAKEGSNT